MDESQLELGTMPSHSTQSDRRDTISLSRDISASRRVEHDWLLSLFNEALLPNHQVAIAPIVSNDDSLDSVALSSEQQYANLLL